jgi:putative tryptophan/tyrosine transport system substrate-binding protein
MNRREFVSGFTFALIAAPLGEETPSTVTKVYKIGIVWATNPAGTAPLFDLLRRALAGAGYTEGRNVTFEQRWAEGRPERIPSLMAELLGSKVDLFIEPDNRLVAEAKRATSEIPIVMVWTFNPVGSGLISSLARPGENVTGVTHDVAPEQMGNYFQFLKEVNPRLARMALLMDKSEPGSEVMWQAAEITSHKLGLALQLADVQGLADLVPAFEAMRREGAEAIFVNPYGLLWTARGQAIELAMKNRLPTIFPVASMASEGALMGYGPSVAEGARSAAYYVDKILKGAKPADLPVEQPTKFELVINLKTARALGLTIPPSLLLRADQVIE